MFKPSKEKERESRRKTLEQIISKLRAAEVAFAQGETVGLICLRLGILLAELLPLVQGIWRLEDGPGQATKGS